MVIFAFSQKKKFMSLIIKETASPKVGQLYEFIVFSVFLSTAHFLTEAPNLHMKMTQRRFISTSFTFREGHGWSYWPRFSLLHNYIHHAHISNVFSAGLQCRKL